MSFDVVALGWQITALVVAGLLVTVTLRFVSAWEDGRARVKEVLRIEDDLAELRDSTLAWLQDQRSAHAKILEDHIARLKTLESAVAVSQARIASLEQINEVTKEPQAPGAIGPFLRNRKAGTT